MCTAREGPLVNEQGTLACIRVCSSSAFDRQLEPWHMVPRAQPEWPELFEWLEPAAEPAAAAEPAKAAEPADEPAAEPAEPAVEPGAEPEAEPESDCSPLSLLLSLLLLLLALLLSPPSLVPLLALLVLPSSLSSSTTGVTLVNLCVCARALHALCLRINPGWRCCRVSGHDAGVWYRASSGARLQL